MARKSEITAALAVGSKTMVSSMLSGSKRKESLPPSSIPAGQEYAQSLINMRAASYMRLGTIARDLLLSRTVEDLSGSEVDCLSSAVVQRARAFLRPRRPGFAASSLSSTEARIDHGSDKPSESSTFSVESVLFSLLEGTGSSQPISEEEEE